MPDTNGVFSRYEYRSRGLAIAGRDFRYVWVWVRNKLTNNAYSLARFVTFQLGVMWLTITLNLNWTDFWTALFVSGTHLLTSIFWSMQLFLHAKDTHTKLDVVHNAAVMAMWETTNYDRFNRFPKVKA